MHTTDLLNYSGSGNRFLSLSILVWAINALIGFCPLLRFYDNSAVKSPNHVPTAMIANPALGHCHVVIARTISGSTILRIEGSNS
jgi:hypothetical protein